MQLSDVQKWARVTFGPYSHQYLLIRAMVWGTEEWLGMLIREVEQRGETVELDLPEVYLKRIKGNPQERVS